MTPKHPKLPEHPFLGRCGRLCLRLGGYVDGVTTPTLIRAPLLKRAQSQPVVATVLGVQKRYNADDGGQHAAAISYYAFLSVFPLMLLATAVVGYVISSRPSLATEFQARIATLVPGLGVVAADNLDVAARTKATAGIIAFIGLAWTGTAVAVASSKALSRIFRTEHKSNIVVDKVRTLIAMVTLGGLGLAGVAAAAAVGAANVEGLAGMALATTGVLVGFVLDAILFRTAYSLLTPGKGPPVGMLWPGAVLAAAGWMTLKLAGGWYAVRVIAKSGAVYGAFATTVGLLVMLNLAARVFIYGAELNALLSERSGGELLERKMETAK